MARSLQPEGHWYGPDPLEIENNFESYLNDLSLEKLKTEFWIMDGDEVAGRLNLHHTLNEELKIRGGHIGYGICSKFRNKGLGTKALKAALQIAKDRGITEVLITCDDNNFGSIRVIENNGGVLRDKVVAPGRTIYTRRYIISLA